MQQQRSRPLRRARELIRSRDGWPPLTQAPPVSCCLGASLIALSNLQTIPLINILVLCSKVIFFLIFNLWNLDIFCILTMFSLVALAALNLHFHQYNLSLFLLAYDSVIATHNYLQRQTS